MTLLSLPTLTSFIDILRHFIDFTGHALPSYLQQPLFSQSDESRPDNVRTTDRPHKRRKTSGFNRILLASLAVGSNSDNGSSDAANYTDMDKKPRQSWNSDCCLSPLLHRLSSPLEFWKEEGWGGGAATLNQPARRPASCPGQRPRLQRLHSHPPPTAAAAAPKVTDIASHRVWPDPHCGGNGALPRGRQLQHRTTPSLELKLDKPLHESVISTNRFSMILRTDDESSTANRIVNGVDSELFARPYQASLQVNIPPFGWFHFCGAAIIDVDRLLTAAHCLTVYPVEALRVEVGVLKLHAPPLEHTQRIDVMAVEIHKDYTRNVSLGFPNDIGVVYLKQSLEYSPNVQPVNIAPLGLTFDLQECIISGWGDVHFQGPSPAVLQEALVTKWTHESCRHWHETLGIHITTNHLCVIGTKDEHVDAPGACHGDSGGPLLCGESQKYLAGVASYVLFGCTKLKDELRSRGANILGRTSELIESTRLASGVTFFEW
ncbi:hypothetical protein Btru_009685 [Bulinus truncatus]|nr:hypothetical protein Btru_009685 [Bulinus truncatus]